MPQHISMLFNKPLFYSAKVYQDGRAFVTIKAKDEQLLYNILNIDPQKYEKDYERNPQRINYSRLKEKAAADGKKLIYKKIDAQLLQLLKKENFDMAYFNNDDNITVCFEESSSLYYMQIVKEQDKKGWRGNIMGVNILCFIVSLLVSISILYFDDINTFKVIITTIGIAVIQLQQFQKRMGITSCNKPTTNVIR